jgi:uncharacterized protein
VSHSLIALATSLRMTRVRNEQEDGVEALDDTAAQTVLAKLAKMRQESIDMYAKAGKEEAAAGERYELSIMQEYLPAMADEATVRGWITDAIEQTCPDGPDKKLMGKARMVVLELASMLEGGIGHLHVVCRHRVVLPLLPPDCPHLTTAYRRIPSPSGHGSLDESAQGGIRWQSGKRVGQRGARGLMLRYLHHVCQCQPPPRRHAHRSCSRHTTGSRHDVDV